MSIILYLNISKMKKNLLNTSRYSLQSWEKDANLVLVNSLVNCINSTNYDLLVLFMWNFILQIDPEMDEAFPLIPEAFIDNAGNIIDERKYTYSLSDDIRNRFDISFSYRSLEIGILLAKVLQKKKPDLLVVPLISWDDKYSNIDDIPSDKQRKSHTTDLYNRFFTQGYAALPLCYRELLEDLFWGVKNTKRKLRIIPDLLRKSWQGNVVNDFVLSEKSLVNRFNNISSRHENSDYIDYKNSLGNSWSSCSLELFHLLTTIKSHKSQLLLDQTNDDIWKILMLQFIPDACQWSASISARSVTSNDENFDIINVVPLMSWSSHYIVNKISIEWSTLL